MKAFNNARERDVETWESLFVEADSRFRFLGVSVPPGRGWLLLRRSGWGSDGHIVVTLRSLYLYILGI